MKKTAIILGSTGLVGSYLMDLLLSGDEYELVISFVRKATGLSHPKLKEYVIDFDKSEYYKELIKGDDLFCCLGTTIKKAGSQEAFSKVDLIYPITFGNLAKENGLKKYLLISSIGANAKSSAFYLNVKGQCEEQLKKIGLPSVFIFRPSLLLGKRQEFRLGEIFAQYLMKIFSFLMIGRFRKYKPIQSYYVAEAMYNAAQLNDKGFHIINSVDIMKYV